jgi:hypothetical protein
MLLGLPLQIDLAAANAMILAQREALMAAQARASTAESEDGCFSR